MSDVEQRLAALEAAVSDLTATVHGTGGTHAVVGTGDLWALEETERRAPEGAVVLAGHLRLPAGPVRWQWGRDTGELLGEEWDASAAALAALGHPVRLRLLQRVLAGTTTTAELGDDEELGTTGQLHHHLRALVAAGWLRSTGRGRYEVPVARVVPLLAVVAATTSP